MKEIIVDIETRVLNQMHVFLQSVLSYLIEMILKNMIYNILKNNKKTFYVRINKDSCDKISLDVSRII
jgi:hypothetical protein